MTLYFIQSSGDDKMFIEDIIKAVTGSTTVQTLIFDTDKYTQAQAVAWAKDHKFKYGNVRMTGSSCRLMQIPEGKFDSDSFRTIEMTDGIKAVIGKLKKGINNMNEIINKTSDKGLFKAFIPLSLDKNKVKVIEKKVKVDDNTEITKKFLIGEASNTKIDKADDRVSKSFLKKMTDQLPGLNVFVEHEIHLEKTIGNIDDTILNDDGESLTIAVALEDEADNDIVKKILKKIDNGIKLAFSIQGKLTKATKTFMKDINKTVRELIDGEIYEVSLTALPEGNVDFVSSIKKSLKDFVDAMDDETESDEEKITKALQEMMDSTGLHRDLYDLFDAYRSAVYRITYDDQLSPSEKKEKIKGLSTEYSDKVEEISSKLADLTEKIEDELS